MPQGAFLIWVLSGVILGLVLLYELVKIYTDPARRRWAIGLTAIVAALAVIGAGFMISVSFPLTGGVESKGGTSATPWVMVGAMYAAMVFGIIAQSYYFGEHAPPASTPSWLKPLLASPIIFIPLLSSFQSSLSARAEIGMADLMILLVSFQNGFFWKVVFDKQAEVMSKRRAR
jgi:hypothetical protein